MEALRLNNRRPVMETVEVNDSYLFGCISEHQSAELKKYSEKVVLHKGEHIYRQGDDDQYIYFIEQGSVKQYSLSQSGKEVIKNILYPQNLVGEEIFSKIEKRRDFAKVIDPVVVLTRIHVEDLRALTQRYWEVNEQFISLLTKKLARTQQRVAGLIIDDARKRIIDFLKYNAVHKGRKVGMEMLIKHSMTQQDIANFTGTSRQTVTSILNDLRKTNKIYFKRNSILIRDMASLA